MLPTDTPARGLRDMIIRNARLLDFEGITVSLPHLEACTTRVDTDTE